MNIEVGDKLKFDYGPDHVSNKTLHVRAIIDKEYIVWRRWYKGCGWYYGVETDYYFYLAAENGNLKRNGKRVRGEDLG